MPKTLTATSVEIRDLSINAIAGVVDGLRCNVNIKYGDFVYTENFDFWKVLTAGQRASIQAVYSVLLNKLTVNYLA